MSITTIVLIAIIPVVVVTGFAWTGIKRNERVTQQKQLQKEMRDRAEAFDTILQDFLNMSPAEKVVSCLIKGHPESSPPYGIQTTYSWPGKVELTVNNRFGLTLQQDGMIPIDFTYEPSALFGSHLDDFLKLAIERVAWRHREVASLEPAQHRDHRTGGGGTPEGG